MKALSIAAGLVVLSLGVAPTFATEYEADTIHGRSEFALESALRERGVAVSSVEEWGDLVRVWVQDGQGGTTMQFFDGDTLQPASQSRG